MFLFNAPGNIDGKPAAVKPLVVDMLCVVVAMSLVKHLSKSMGCYNFRPIISSFVIFWSSF